MNVDLHNLKMTDEEARELEWCRSNLEEELLIVTATFAEAEGQPV